MSEIQPAGRIRRLTATIIDALLVPLFALVLMLVSGVLEHAEDYANHPWLRVIGLGVASYLILNGWLLWTRGQTLGKLILRVTIVNNGTTDQAPLWKLLLIRGPIFIMLTLVDVLPIFSKRRRCIHDWGAGTQVILRRSKR